jgi:hypothetical protein
VQANNQKGTRLKTNKAIEILLNADLPGGITQDRIDKLIAVIGDLSDEDLIKLRIETCAHGGGDPNRYGKSKKRAGRCIRIGQSRNNGSPIQIWAVWN